MATIEISDQVLKNLIDQVNGLKKKVDHLSRLEQSRFSRMNVGLAGAQAGVDDLVVDGEIIHNWTPGGDPDTKIIRYWNNPGGDEWVIEGITTLSTLATGTNDIPLGVDLDDWGNDVRTGVNIYGYLAADDGSSNLRSAQFTARARWVTSIGNQGGTVVADESAGIITAFSMDIDATTHEVELRVTTNTVTLAEIVIHWIMIGTNL